MSGCAVAGGGAAALARPAAQLGLRHGGPYLLAARAPSARGLGPSARQRLSRCTAIGQRGREAHGGPEQPPGQGDGRGGPGAPGRQLHVPRHLLSAGLGAGARGPAGTPRRAGERGGPSPLVAFVGRLRAPPGLRKSGPGRGALAPGAGHVSVSLLGAARGPSLPSAATAAAPVSAGRAIPLAGNTKIAASGKGISAATAHPTGSAFLTT